MWKRTSDEWDGEAVWTLKQWEGQQWDSEAVWTVGQWERQQWDNKAVMQ